MSVPEALKQLPGTWSGKNSLWLSPDADPDESTSTAWVALAAKGQFITIQYNWSYNGEPHEGLLLVGYEKAGDQVKGMWVDSWHMSDKFMVCEGRGDQQNLVSIRGSYSAPPGPDWGWRISIDPVDKNVFRMLMYNISPDGDEALAVESVYTRLE